MEATEERDNILEILEETREGFLANARNVANLLYDQKQKPICIDDVRELCPPPEDVDPRVMGAVFKQSEWKKVGYKNSTRGHARAIALFEPV